MTSRKDFGVKIGFSTRKKRRRVRVDIRRTCLSCLPRYLPGKNLNWHQELRFRCFVLPRMESLCSKRERTGSDSGGGVLRGHQNQG